MEAYLKKEAHKRRHEYVTNPSWEVLQQELFRAIRVKKEQDPFVPVVVLVGSNLMRNYLARQLAMDSMGHANVFFLTFIDLASRLAESTLAARGLEPLPAEAAVRLADCAARMLDGDSYFADIARRPGFHRALAATFSDLREAGLDAEGFEAAVQGLSAIDPGAEANRRLQELSGLFSFYRRAFREKHYDSADLFQVAEEQAAAGVFKQACGSDSLLIYGFADFSGRQRSLLEAIAASTDLMAFVPYSNTPAYRFARKTVEWLDLLGAQPKGIPGRRPSENASVTIVSAPSPIEEVREVARRIIKLAVEGVPFNEMAVIYRTPDPYSRLVREVFDTAAIPYYQRCGPGLETTQPGRALLLFLNLLGSEFPRQDVLEWLHAAPLDPIRLGIGGIDPSRWDDVTAEAHIVRGRGQWVERLVRYRQYQWRSIVGGAEAISLDSSVVEPSSVEVSRAFKNRPEEKYRAAMGLERVMAALFRAADGFPEEASWSRYVEAAQLFVEQTFTPSPDRDAVVEALDGLKALDSIESEVDLDGFRTVVADRLAQARPVGRFQRDGVNVLDVMSARGIPCRVVFLCGMVEKSFPAQARQDPLFLDSEREALSAYAPDLVLNRHRYEEEMLLFSLATHLARERLVLSYPRAETAGGRDRLPSSFLLRLAEALSGQPKGYADLSRMPGFERVAGSPIPPGRGIDALCEMDVLLNYLASDPSALREWVGSRSFLSRGGRLRLARWSNSFTAYDGVLGPEALPHLVNLQPNDRTVSATELESYAKCPFRYLLEKVLGIAPREEPEEALQITPLDRGNLIHTILEKFYRGLREDGKLPLYTLNADEARSRLHDVIEEACLQWEEKGLTGHPTLWGVDREDIRLTLELFLERELAGEDGFGDTLTELPFGMSSGPIAGVEAQALELDLGNGHVVRFKGKIDRIDVSSEGSRVRVIDYKTGKLGIDRHDSLCGGEALQLPIYLLAAARMTECDVPNVEARYVNVNPFGPPWIGFSGLALQAQSEAFNTVIGTIVSGIHSGHFFPYPQGKDKCDYCAVKPACSHGVSVIWERKAGDPLVGDFLDMKGVK